MIQEFTGLPPGRALDLAAGAGRNALWLAEQGWQVLALDFPRVAIERGHRLAAERVVQVSFLHPFCTSVARRHHGGERP